MKTGIEQPYNDTRLFLLRMWVESEGDSERAWRGKVLDVVSGEAHLFTDGPALLDHLLRMLPPAEGPPDPQSPIRNPASNS